MANTKNDVAQQATRWFLTEVGGRYDDLRGRQRFRPTRQQWDEGLAFFGHACAYCGIALAEAPILKDHLIPLNRDAGGLHAWGNVVPSCRPCNNAKGGQYWRDWLPSIGGAAVDERGARIDAFTARYNYSPSAAFVEEAQALYAHMVTMAEAVIAERLAASEAKIASLVKPSDKGG